MRETIIKQYGTDTFITNTWNFAQVSVSVADINEQGAHAGLIMSYFRFYIYTAIKWSG